MCRHSLTMKNDSNAQNKVPIDRVLEPPTMMAKYTCASALVGVIGVWARFAFIPEAKVLPVHSLAVPASLVAFYLVSLPLLRMFTNKYLRDVDVKSLLRESMIVYNASQVVLNLWMVGKILDALFFRGHGFIGQSPNLVDTGATYAIWVHYCDKFLEFFDTYFMVLRGKMDQVSFLHIYHHTSIALAWWVGLSTYRGGDLYFGALVNSWIHVMMYSYYTLSLLKIRCPWKKYLTMAQLAQFVSVVIYSCSSLYLLTDYSTGILFGYLLQIFEMTSLFVLFMGFYRKAYKKPESKPTNDSETISDTLESEQASISSAGSAN